MPQSLMNVEQWWRIQQTQQTMGNPFDGMVDDLYLKEEGLIHLGQRCNCHCQDGHSLPFQAGGMWRDAIRALDSALWGQLEDAGVSLLCSDGTRENDVKVRKRGRQWGDEWEKDEKHRSVLKENLG